MKPLIYQGNLKIIPLHCGEALIKKINKCLCSERVCDCGVPQRSPITGFPLNNDHFIWLCMLTSRGALNNITNRICSRLCFILSKKSNIMCELHIMALGDYTLTPCGLFSIPWHPSGKSTAWQSCLSEPSLRGADEAEGGENRLRSSHAESDSHYQLRLFLFLFTATINRTVTGSQGQREWKGGRERERERKGQFSSKRIIYQNKWDECALEPCQSGPPLKALWTDEDLYVFNRKRVSSKG